MSARTIIDRIDTHLRMTRINLEAALNGLTGAEQVDSLPRALRPGLLGSLDDLADDAEACRTISDQVLDLLHSLPLNVEAKAAPEYGITNVSRR